jgi:hypothetical protein
LNTQDIEEMLNAIFEDDITKAEFPRLARVIKSMVRISTRDYEDLIETNEGRMAHTNRAIAESRTNGAIAQPRVMNLRQEATQRKAQQRSQEESESNRGTLVERAQVLLQERGPMNVADIATELSCSPPTLYKTLREKTKLPAIQTKRPGGGRSVTFYGPTGMNKTQLQAEVNKMMAAQMPPNGMTQQEHQAQA